MQERWNRVITLLVLSSIVGLVLASVAGTVGAQEDSQIDIEWESEYNGISDDGDQAITLSVTLTAEQTTDGITVDFTETNNAFIDQSSYQVTVAESNWESPFNGRYVIEQLESGDAITFTFDVYPRVLDQESLIVSTVSIDAENPQTYQQSSDLDANLSSSPWVAYQDELGQDNGGGEQVPRVLIGGSVLFGFVGLVAAGYLLYSKRTAIERKHEEADELFNDLENEVGAGATRKVKNKREEWNEDDDGGTNGIDDVDV